MLDLNQAFAALPVIETARCTLRPVAANDAENLFRLYSNPDVNRFLGRFPMTSLAEAEERLTILLGRTQEQAGITWLVYHAGQFIGNVVIFKLTKDHSRAEIGYSILPEWWGQGLVSEVVPCLIDFAFNTLGLHSLEAQIDSQNIASRRVLEKQGFVQEGYFRENFFDPVQKQFVDTVVFSLLNQRHEQAK
jgi:[ribosomal protein S5]-alanine N-acetyltransferase